MAKGLNKLYYIKIEIENLKKEIECLQTLSALRMTGMPHGSGLSDPTAKYTIKKEQLMEKLDRKMEKYTDELVRIEGVIEQIQDIEVRTIARMRFIQHMKWEDIGKKVHLERTTCAKKLKRYLKNMDIQ